MVFDSFYPIVIIARNFFRRENIRTDVEIFDFRVVFGKKLKLLEWVAAGRLVDDAPQVLRQGLLP